MSYCRIGKDSAIYLIATGKGWECVVCRMKPFANGFNSMYITDPNLLLAHLEDHMSIGQRVPKRVFDRLKREGH